MESDAKFFGGFLAMFGAFWIIGIILSIVVTVVLAYAVIFYAIIPGLHVVAPMFGFPG
jgi:hypothetical protein